MSGRLLRLVCTATVAAQAAVVPTAAPATAAPEPRALPDLLTDLRQRYRQVERATATYRATDRRLRAQRAEVARLDGALARARLALQDSRGAAGRLARQQYQATSDLSPYVRLLLARDPQHALDQGHVVARLARHHAATLHRLTGTAHKADELARKSREALDRQLTLARQHRKQRDEVRNRLTDVEKLLASLTPEQLTAIRKSTAGDPPEGARGTARPATTNPQPPALRTPHGD
ncbi:coiled-coil domain-containing protein [Streptomyces flavalbus]|uniref:Coiled-coil domain-containing protein n=1 Tax=Streptomyces flavalbus TaxID=2665155 RepID=A0ABW2WFU5_9ACTN